MAHVGDGRDVGVVSATGRLKVIGAHVAHRCCNISNNSGTIEFASKYLYALSHKNGEIAE